MVTNEHIRPLPRLTGTLRAFSRVSPRYDEQSAHAEMNLMKRRRERNVSLQSKGVKSESSERTWQNLVDALVPEKNNSKFSKLKTFLDKLRTNMSKQFLNEDFNDAGLLNEASLFIFESFYDHRSVSSMAASSNFEALDKLNKKLKEKFGQFQKNLFDQCRELFEVIFNEIDSLDRIKILDEFFKSKNLSADILNSSDINNLDDYFGLNIQFHSFYDKNKHEIKDLENYHPKLYPSRENDDEDDYYDDDDDNDEFGSQLELSPKIEFPTKSTGFIDDAVAGAMSSGQQSDQSMMKHLEWTQHVNNEIVPLVNECLCSKSRDEDLQNELVELVGFDHLEIVEFLLLNRKKVVTAYKLYMQDESGTKRRFQAIEPKAGNSSTTGKKPTIATEIVVHTETEKRIKKQIMKEEKKLKQLKISNDQAAGFEEEFDPAMLKKIREEQLSEARLLQLYNQKKLDSLSLEELTRRKADQYPFVFDTLAHITQTSAYIAGSRILLPDNVNRTDTRAYEEVHIPPTDSIGNMNPEKFRGRKEEICLRPLIKSSELDSIGQIAFRNVKQLNRIQSVVFEAAYNTNQNLLICAPTGAGKTNIAMLTIVNQIKKHFNEAGVLRKDEFKIVYIAPMKALAAEMVENFSKRLEPLGIVVRELTGDMQLTKQEILETQMLVTTPEKWDVVTRKSLGDISLSLLVKLLIIDEVHLLHDDRGSVIETIVARTLRQVESSQKMIRIVGLSATLPNYLDVARFLNVDPKRGLFFFDSRFRPVPLAQTFIGVKSQSKLMQQQQMDEVCYDKCVAQLRAGNQVMIFVHARNATLKTALKLRDMAKENGDISLFQVPEQSKEYGDAQKQMLKSRNKQLREIFDDGFAVHHAGLLRSDRNLVERLFSQGHVRVLVCTATLAWGVNLPAHAVIIKGTELYDAQKGAFVDISMLDILQIFGRAGRPQFDTSGEAYIITTYAKLAHYLGLLTRQTPIESQFAQSLADNLNAEVCLGSVSNVPEAVRWLSYTYMFVRMKCNPLAYGLTYRNLEDDPSLEQHREDLVRIAARLLDKTRMMRFDEASGILNPTDLGRTASHFYIKYDTIDMFNGKLKDTMNDKEILSMMSECSEFQQLKVREEEFEELFMLAEDCVVPVKIAVEDTIGKVNCLIQSYISRIRIEGFSLVSDMAYVSQNIGRIARALYEISVKRGWALLSGRLLNICKSIEKQIWHFQSPMRQFEAQLKYDIVSKIEEKSLTIEKMKELSGKELGIMLYNQKMGEKIKECISNLPVVEIETSIHPITRTVLRVKITLTANFKWNDRLHGTSEPFWLWIEDPSHNHIYHFENFSLLKKQAKLKEPQMVVFTIPIFEPLPSQYIVRLLSDRWLGVEFSQAISFKHLILPDQHAPHTELLDLDPLPISALKNSQYEALYSFSHFNPIQTQIFHCLYHTDNNCLLGAPTGSGKTIAAEMAIFRVFNMSARKKCVYIAPLKALVRERMIDWKVRLEEKLGKKVVELTGDVTPDMKMVAESDVIVTTPEKWDGISRSWQTRNYVKDVALIVIDEIHLLGEDRGPVLEVIVSRTNFISSHTHHPVRVIGLSTALANARDLANWLGIKQLGLYNFKPSVRPVPLEVHIQGYSGKFYCPRMATMNKPCFQEIQIHSPNKPVLIFVSSRRQTRMTALDLVSFLARDLNPKQWLHMSDAEMAHLCQTQVSDQNLKLTLAFGIGLHHAGLNDRDRKLVEELFVNQRIQILIATSTLAWGVNFPAHLVVVKGTEYFDPKSKRYVDFPITDVLQMMGRAGRPQFDDSGIAVIMVHDVKKHFYKKFLYEPFPVESSLLAVLSDHLNAEIVASTITSTQEAIEYLTWTYFFRRLLVNPSYYGLESLDPTQINTFLSSMIRKCLQDLEESKCVKIDESGALVATTSAHIASYYYLTHFTMRIFHEMLNDKLDIESLIDIVSLAHEFDEFPVRHNEDKLNEELSHEVPFKVNSYTLDSPHTKVNLLLQAHFSRAQLPCSDYFTDTKSVLDQCFRIMQAILDFCAEHGWLHASLYLINLMQMACQGRWLSESDLLSMPHVETEHLNRFYSNDLGRRIDCLPALIQAYDQNGGDKMLENLLGDLFDANQLRDLKQVIGMLPKVDVKMTISGDFPMNQKLVNVAKTPKIQVDMSNESHTYSLHEDEEYVLTLDLTRSQSKGGHFNGKAYTPKYSKPKDENWIVILGENVSSPDAVNQLIGLKRVTGLKRHQTTHVIFKTPRIQDNFGRNNFNLTVYLMSDVYLGLDQQFEINFKLSSKTQN